MTYAGRYYNIVFKGDDTIDASTGTTTQYVAMNNDIINARTVTVERYHLAFWGFSARGSNRQNWDGKGRVCCRVETRTVLPTAMLLR